MILKYIFEELNIEFNPAHLFSVGDFNILAEWGIIPVNVGTGALHGHTTREQISIKDLQKLQAIFYRYLVNFPTVDKGL